MGSFRLATGTWHLHHGYNFTGLVVETVHQSLRHSCRSELTRQGTSLTLIPDVSKQGWTISLSDLSQLPAYLIQGRTICRVHCSGKINDFDQSFPRQMTPLTHQMKNAAELVEIDVLFCLQRVTTKEVAHLLKSFEFADSQTEPVVVITANDARLKETFERLRAPAGPADAGPPRTREALGNLSPSPRGDLG